MRSSHAACISAAPSNLISKFISLFCAVTLCCGLVPSAAFAANDDSLSLIPEGEQGAVSIASNAEGGSDDAVSHSASDDASSADGDGAASTSENANDNEGSDAAGSAEAGDGALGGGISGGDAAVIPAADLNIINQVEPLQVVAQVESTRNYFLAQTLESTHTVPVVSAKLPIDTGATSDLDVSTGDGSSNEGNGEAGESTEGGDDSDESDLAGLPTVAVESTVVGSFEYLGMTFAIENGGESVALVAADYNKLPETFIENQVVVIPDTVTADGIDLYSVTRIADGAFASFKDELAHPDYVGCQALFSNEELLGDAGIEYSEIERLFTNDDSRIMTSTEESNDGLDRNISTEASEDESSDEPLHPDVAAPVVISSTQKLSTDFKAEASDSDIRTIASMEDGVATLDDGTACAFADPFVDRAGILVLGIPASMATIESDAFDGFETLQYFVVSDENENYTSFDGALYNADLTQLQLVPEGRTGVLLIPENAVAAAANDDQSNVILVEASSVQETTVNAHESIDVLLARLLPNIPQEERSNDAEVLESMYVPVEPSETDSVTSMETVATYDAKSSELFDIYGLNASTTLYQVGSVSSASYLYATQKSFSDETLTLTSTDKWTGVERIFFDSHRLILSYNYYSSEAGEQRTGYKGFGLTTSGGITRVQFKTSKSSTATLYDVPRGTQGMSVAEMRAMTGSSSSAIYLSFSTTAWTPSVVWLSPYSGTSSTSSSIQMHRAGNLADPAPTVYFEAASMNLPAAPSTTFSSTNTLSSADRIFFKNNRMIIRHFYRATELGNVQRFAYLSYGLTCDGGITGITLRASNDSNARTLPVNAGDVGVGFDEIKAELATEDMNIDSGATIYVEFTTAASSSSAVATNWIANGGKWSDSATQKSLWLAKGASSSGPSLTLTRAGYKFYGWSTSPSALPTTTGEYAPKTSVNVTANGVYYAVWGRIKKVTLDQQGATTQASKKELYYVFGSSDLWTNDTCTTKYSTTTSVVPKKTNYVFAGYYSAAGTGTSTQYITALGAKTDSVTASLGGNASDSMTMYANWIPVSTITVYKHMGNDNAESAKLYYKHGGDTLYTDIACTTAWTASIYKLTRSGYTFGGWASAKDGSTLYLNTTPAVQTALKNAYKTSTSPSTAVEIHAKWTADTYTITYSLDGGSASNPTTYTIETATFTLKNPTKTGYTFAGWTGTGLSAASKTVKIEKGNTGARSYTATWTKDTYTISYALAGGQWPSNATKPGSFSIDTATFTITDPTRTGYTFAGWTGTGLSSATKALKIEKGSTGGRSYAATWTPVEYKITYDLVGGNIPAGSSNPTKYTIETKTFTLSNPTKDGFIFTGWTLGGSTELLEAAEVPIGSTGDRAYTANWTVIPSSENTFTVYPYSEDGSAGTSIDLYSVGWVDPGQSYQDACYKGFPENPKTSFTNSGIKSLDRIYFENGRLILHHFYTHLDEQRDSYIGKGLTSAGGITGIQYSLTNGKDAVFYDMPIGRGGIGLTEIMAQTRASSPPSGIYLRFLTEPQAYPSFTIYPYNPNETVSFYAVGHYSTPGISYQEAAYNALSETPTRTMDKNGINSTERLYFENGRLIVHAYYVANGAQRDCYIAYALTNAGGITRIQYSLTPNETDSSKIYDIEVGGSGISLSEIKELTGTSPKAIYLKFSTEARTPAEAFTVYAYTADGTEAKLLHSAGNIVPGQNYHNATTRNLSAEAGSSISTSRCEDRIFFENGRLILHYYYATEIDGVMHQRDSYVAYGLTCAGGITRVKYSISNGANATFKDVPVGPAGVGAAEIGANTVYVKLETGASNDAFAVNWIGNGGKWADGRTQKASWEKKGSSLSGPGTTPEREGYRFYGWATSSTAAPSEAAETVTPSSATTYYAIWGLIVTVTLDQRSATEDAATTMLYYAFGDRQFYTNAGCTNAYTPATVIPARTGYTFDGYYTRANGEGDRYFNEKGEMTQAVTASLWNNDSSEATLKANWTVNTYNITWDANEGVNGTVDDSYAKQTYGSTIKILGAPSRTGYVFVGWYTKATGGDKLATNAKVGAEDRTYYAHWDEATYTVVFNEGDGTFESSWPAGTFKYQSDEMTAPDVDDISRYGFTLAGWSTKTNPANADIVTTGVGTIAPGDSTKVSALYAGSSSIPEDIMLYPVWSADTYTISLESNEGVYDEAGLADLMDALANDPKAEFGGNQMTYTILTPAFTIPSLTKTGWVFDGWSADSGSTKKPTVRINPAANGFTLGNLSYEACWSISDYVVKYYEEEGSIKEAAFTSDVISSFDVDGPSTMTIPDPVRKGYTFTGWSGPGLLGSENKGADVIVNLKELITDELPKGPDEVALAYYAHWTQDTYTVTYVLNDDDFNYLGAFRSEYKGFDGNTVLDANDDGTYTDTYRYDETKQADALTLPSKTGSVFDLTRPGYVFAGWVRVDGEKVGETTIEVIDPKTQAEELTFKACWNPVVSVALPVTSQSIDFRIDAATGQTEDVVTGTPQALTLSSATPVATELTISSSAGEDDVSTLFWEVNDGDGSAVLALINSLGFSFDASECDYVASEKKDLTFGRANGNDGVVVLTGSEAYATKGLTSLKVLPVKGAFALMQANADASGFSPLKIDLSKIRIKSEQELQSAGISKLHLADVVWTVRLKEEANAIG